MLCDCEHHTHEPSAMRAASEHDFGTRPATVTIKSPWGGTFHLCQACLDAGHMQGTQFR
jgi:hypothetical protein